MKDFLHLIQDIPINQRETGSLKSGREKLLRMVRELPTISTLKDFGQVCAECERWLGKNGLLTDFLMGRRDLPVPQAASTYSLAFSIINDVPKTIPHVLPREVTLPEYLLTLFRKQAEIAVSNRSHIV